MEVPESKSFASDKDRIIEVAYVFCIMDRYKLSHAKHGKMNEVGSMATYLLRCVRGDTLANIDSIYNIAS